MSAEPARYCRGCGYSLHGLPEPRCPECGRNYDPADPRTYWLNGIPSRLDRLSDNLERFARAAGSALVRPPVPIALCWLESVLPLTMVPGLFLGAISAVRSGQARRWAVCFGTISLCLAGLSSHVMLGMADYARGTAELRDFGLPIDVSLYNVDPVYRCGRTWTCMIPPGGRFPAARYNLGVKLMIRIFGPMPGAYTGPYPTEGEALNALRSAAPVSVDELARDNVPLTSGPVALDQGVGLGLLRYSDWGDAVGDPAREQMAIQQLGPITAAPWKTCVVLRIPEAADFNGPASGARIVVIDVNRGRPFAHFSDGRIRFNPPPVGW